MNNSESLEAAINKALEPFEFTFQPGLSLSQMAKHSPKYQKLDKAGRTKLFHEVICSLKAKGLICQPASDAIKVYKRKIQGKRKGAAVLAGARRYSIIGIERPAGLPNDRWMEFIQNGAPIDVPIHLRPKGIPERAWRNLCAAVAKRGDLGPYYLKDPMKDWSEERVKWRIHSADVYARHNRRRK